MDEMMLTPPEIAEAATSASSELLPKKSIKLYEKTYEDFISWCSDKNVSRYSESVLLAYFAHIAEKGLIASMWPKYSMIKATLNLKHGVDISKFPKLVAFIKRKVEGHVPKKSKVFEKEHVAKFIADAPDHKFLLTKVNINITI